VPTVKRLPSSLYRSLTKLGSIRRGAHADTFATANTTLQVISSSETTEPSSPRRSARSTRLTLKAQNPISHRPTYFARSRRGKAVRRATRGANEFGDNDCDAANLSTTRTNAHPVIISALGDGNISKWVELACGVCDANAYDTVRGFQFFDGLRGLWDHILQAHPQLQIAFSDTERMCYLRDVTEQEAVAIEGEYKAGHHSKYRRQSLSES
jgi:hypothetical protein